VSGGLDRFAGPSNHEHAWNAFGISVVVLLILSALYFA